MKKQQIGRLALRHEGNLWVAYYALENTMDGALFLGSIAMAAIANNTKRKQAFMDIMRSFVADIIERQAGVRPTWGDPRDAPEIEKAGHS